MQGRARRPVPVIMPWKNVCRRPDCRRSTKHLGRAFMAAPPRALDPHAIVGPKNITGGLLRLSKLYASYTFRMTKWRNGCRRARASEEEQDRVAEAVLTFLREWQAHVFADRPGRVSEQRASLSFGENRSARYLPRWLTCAFPLNDCT